MKVLVTGKTGQLGTELARIAWPRGFGVVSLDRSQCDVTDSESIGVAVRTHRPSLVINAAAYTTVDRAESELEAAMRTNGEGPGHLARFCSEIGAALIHLSTDYVFDGTARTPYREDDPTAPLSVYGQTKAMGEAAVRDALKRHVIIRTSWVFSGHGSNFVRTMLKLASQSEKIRVVTDQTGGPTWAGDLALAVHAIAAAIAEGNASWGTFHFTSAEPVTWFEFAGTIFERTGSNVVLEPITTVEFGAPARRPTYSVLDCSRIRQTYGIEQPSWRRALDLTLAELGMWRSLP